MKRKNKTEEAAVGETQSGENSPCGSPQTCACALDPHCFLQASRLEQQQHHLHHRQQPPQQVLLLHSPNLLHHQHAQQQQRPLALHQKMTTQQPLGQCLARGPCETGECRESGGKVCGD